MYILILCLNYHKLNKQHNVNFRVTKHRKTIFQKFAETKPRQ